MAVCVIDDFILLILNNQIISDLLGVGGGGFLEGVTSLFLVSFLLRILAN